MIRISKKLHKIRANFLDYLLLTIALGTIFGAGVYYLYALNWLGVIIIVFLSIISLFYLDRHLFQDTAERTRLNQNVTEKNKYLKYFLYLLYFFLSSASFYLLYLSRSDRALISPWQITDFKFFILYGLSTIILVFILLQNRLSIQKKLIALSIHYFLSFSVALIIYKIGYGFDPFIHQATLELIDKKGLVNPKPFYYLGEYGLIIALHKLSGLSIEILNKLIVPFLAAIFLPLAAYRLTNHNTINKSQYLIPLFLLIITFSPFIVSTPQNLSYLFLILAISFGLIKNKLLWPFILALAALAVHPLTGLPALVWCSYLFLNKYATRLKQKTLIFLKIFIFSFGALSLPLALFIASGQKFKKINWDLNLLIDPLKNLFVNLNSAGQENWLLNFIYFFADNYVLWLILLISGSLIYFYRQTEKPDYQSLIFINLSLACAYLISNQIVFTDLINYEQANFAERLLVLIIIFFIPFIIFSLQKFIDLILVQKKINQVIWLTFGLFFILSSLYISYPRFDKYFNSRGYSTGINDLTAVNLIADTASGPYVVLANQQVSVAALKELGFDHYYKTSEGQIYFYPIPTGGKLYQYYLDMVYKKPSRETMAMARNFTGAKESYFIINKYWFQSSQIINAAKLNADSWQTIKGEVYIFKYLP